MLTNPFSLLAPHADHIQCAFFAKEDPSQTDEEIRRVLDVRKIASLHQMHGNRIIRVSEGTSRTEEADGLVTDTRGLALSIRMADCQGFLVYSPVHHVIGLAHVGWRGLLEGTIPSLLTTLNTEWDISGADLLVCGVPSLCLRCSDFQNPTHEIFRSVPHEFIHGHCVDLPGIAKMQFLDGGVLEERFERRPGCTRCSPEKYWTYRGGDREAVKAGKTNTLAFVLR